MANHPLRMGQQLFRFGQVRVKVDVGGGRSESGRLTVIVLVCVVDRQFGLPKLDGRHQFRLFRRFGFLTFGLPRSDLFLTQNTFPIPATTASSRRVLLADLVIVPLVATSSRPTITTRRFPAVARRSCTDFMIDGRRPSRIVFIDTTTTTTVHFVLGLALAVRISVVVFTRRRRTIVAARQFSRFAGARLGRTSGHTVFTLKDDLHLVAVDGRRPDAEAADVVDVLDQVEAGSVNGIAPSRAFERLARQVESDLPVVRMVLIVQLESRCHRRQGAPVFPAASIRRAWKRDRPRYNRLLLLLMAASVDADEAPVAPP